MTDIRNIYDALSAVRAVADYAGRHIARGVGSADKPADDVYAACRTLEALLARQAELERQWFVLPSKRSGLFT